MKIRLPASLATVAAALAIALHAVVPARAQGDIEQAVETTIDPATYWRIDTSLQSDPENVLLLDLSNGGRVAIRLKPEWAPNHVERIKTLTRQGFYNGVIFHRVIEGFMAQTGDPSGTGRGASELPDLKAEFNRVPHLRGTVSMARGGDDDSANSQFFIVFYPTMQIDRKYTNFGRVIGGMNHVDAIARGQPPANPTRIVQASLASDDLAPPASTPIQREITADMLSTPIMAGRDAPAATAVGDEAID